MRNLHDTLLDDSDPFVHAGMRLSPSLENRLPIDRPLDVLFKLYNLPAGSDHWSLVAKPKLVNENGKELAWPPIPIDESSSKTGDTEATIGINLPFQNAAPGKYKLLIEISETESSQSTMIQTDLELVRN
jgi:hypothetical protein